MYALNSQEFELDGVSPSQVLLFPESPEIEECENGVSANDMPFAAVLRGIETNVISRSEITVIF